MTSNKDKLVHWLKLETRHFRYDDIDLGMYNALSVCKSLFANNVESRGRPTWDDPPDIVQALFTKKL